MACRQLLLVACLAAAVLLSTLRGAASAAVGARRGPPQEARNGVERMVFMRESDASNFLKTRGKRSAKSREEVAAENRQKLWADELWREHHEEQRSEFESHAEEQSDEQAERSREAVEQWREWHYDGLYPPYLYNRHLI